jgi:MtN3 and saliva related transmembrane protein
MSLTHYAQLADWIGSIAATLTTAAFVPQAWMTWKKRHADGVSLGMYTIFTTGVAFWLIYGLLIGAWPIIIANTLTLSLALFILIMKIRFG